MTVAQQLRNAAALLPVFPGCTPSKSVYVTVPGTSAAVARSYAAHPPTGYEIGDRGAVDPPDHRPRRRSLSQRPPRRQIWKTTYDFWSGAYDPFVEPEYDSVGTFLYGVYRHFRGTGEATFSADLWPAVKRSADWLLTSIGQNGFGVADYSIWEEQFAGLQHNSFTRAWFVPVCGPPNAWLRRAVTQDSRAGRRRCGVQSALQRPSDPVATGLLEHEWVLQPGCQQRRHTRRTSGQA